MKRFFIMFLCFFSFFGLNVLANDAPQKPKVSVIIPVYNVERWIRECADSLVNQTLQEMEFIFVDDGSPDNSGAILDEYAQRDSRVKVIHQANAGVQMARNTGLDNATGEYIALVDADDYVERNTYEIAYNYAKKDNVDILNFKARIFDDGNDNHINNVDMSDANVISIEDYIQNNFRCWVWDNLFRAEIIQNDKIRFIKGIKPADDTCFTYMAFGRAKTVKSIPATFYNYRMRPNALSRMTDEEVFINSYKMFKLICDYWRQCNNITNHEHNLMTLIIRWLISRYDTAINYAQEVLDSFGSDVYNTASIKKCPVYVQNILKNLEKSAKYSKNRPIENGIYEIISAIDGNKVLDISEASKKDGANLQIWTKNSTDAQKFIVRLNERGYYTLTSLVSGKNIDVANAGMQQGTNIWQYQNNNTRAQKWYIVPCGDGYYKMISQCNFLTMDVAGAENKNGTNVRCWDDNGTKAQKFRFVKMDNINDEPISIAMASDKNYIYPTIVCLTSMLENKNPDTKINFYIMLSGDCEQTIKNDIQSLQYKYENCSINLIDMKDKFNSAYTSRNITKAAYYRLMLSSLLPNLDKILYIDTDTIVKSDLKKLFSYNMDNYYVAGVLDGIIPINGSHNTMQQEAAIKKGYNAYEQVIGIPDMNQYINSGLCLFNLKKMREDRIEEKLIEAVTTHNYDWHDQDAINVVCYDKIRLLPLKYNFMLHCLYSGDAHYLYSHFELSDAHDNLQVIHYTGIKPWENPYHVYADLWWKYAEKTFCFSKIQEKYLISNGIYTIVSALNNNKVLDIDSASNKDRALLQIYDRNNTSAQKFLVKYVGNRQFEISPQCSGKLLDVNGAGKTSGTAIQQFTKNGTDAQKWYIMPLENGNFKIVSCCNNLVMDVSEAKTKNRTKVKCWEDNGTNAQKFRFDRIG